MLEGKPFKFKICLIGETAVGKTSLVKKYVLNEFQNKYITTLGTKVTKKEIKIKHPKTKELADVHLMIWDIIGQKGFRQLVQEAYFFGAHGIIGVCDNTRGNTLFDLNGWMDVVHDVAEDIPAVFLGNKYDLEDYQEVGLSELVSFASGYEKTIPYLSSAKTGLNVELAFRTLSENILKEGLDIEMKNRQ